MFSQPGGCALAVVAVQRLLIVGLGIAEELLGPGQVLRRRADQPVEVVVTDLVAEVAEQRAVRLVHRDAQLLAVHVVTLGKIQGDHAVFVAGEHLLELAGQQVERQPVLRVHVAADDRQLEVDAVRRPAAAWPSRRPRTRPSPRCRRRWAGCGSARTTCTAPADRLHLDQPIAFGDMQIRAQLVLGWRRRHRRARCPRPMRSPASAISSRENPSRLPHDRHTEFSNARCWPQLGQMKSRMQHSPFEGRYVDRDVDHAAFRVRVDDAAQRRHVRIVSTPSDDDVTLVDHLIVGRVQARATGSAASTPTPTRGWRRCRPFVPCPAAGRWPDSRTRNWRPGRWRAGRRSPAGRSPDTRPPAPRDLARPESTPSWSPSDR